VKLRTMLCAWSICLACVGAWAKASDFGAVEVGGFHSEVGDRCIAADIPLSAADVHAFFVRSRLVSARIVHDDYDLLPCHLSGRM